jgi:hypothetical protein
MSNYNPYTSALSAAAAELTSPEAQRYYINRAQQDVQTSIVLIIQFGCFAYAFGAQCRKWAEDVTVTDSGDIAQSIAPGALVLATPAAIVAPMVPVCVVAIASVTPAALPSFQPFALLNPAPKAKRTRTKSPTQPTEAPVKGKRGRKPKALAIA